MERTPWDPEGVEVRLNEAGQLADPNAAERLDLRELFEQLLTARVIDNHLTHLGLPMWAPTSGGEAPLVALGTLLHDEDWVFSGGRDIPLALARGVQLTEVLRQVLGLGGARVRVQAGAGAVGSSEYNLVPPTESMGLQVGMATGFAHAQKLGRAPGITVATFGEGLTTVGAVSEALAIASAQNLPLVFLCKSQLWPEAPPAEAGVFGDPVQARSSAMGMWARRVDGADLVAVHDALDTACARARDGLGPCMVECIVTPLHRAPPPHRDPVERLRRFLEGAGTWTQTFHDIVEAKAKSKFQKALHELGVEQ
jgi:pyruvate dehydrogenase E1 component alpha subunit